MENMKSVLQFKCERFGNNKPKLTFFKRINYRKGRATAISATARKLAVIIWSMLYKGQDNNPSKEYLYLDQKRKLKRVNKI